MRTRGLTLVEVVIGIALVSVLIVGFGVSLLAAVYAQRIKVRNTAAALADEQLAVIRSSDTASLSNQTGGPLFGVLFNQGTWAVAADGTAPSPPNALGAAASSATGITALAQLPDNAYADVVLTASFKVLSGAPSGWKAGFIFRASDLRNHYQIYLTSSSLVLKKVVNGAETTIYADARVVATDAWQTLRVTASASSLSIELNGSPVTTQTDATFSIGRAALAVWEGAGARFDDVSASGESWDFDSDATGAMPADWRRFGLSDLPSGTGTLTVTSPFSDPSLRRYTVTIGWTDKRGGTASLSQSTLKAD